MNDEANPRPRGAGMDAVTRRTLLRAGVTGGAALMLPSGLLACGGSDTPTPTTDGSPATGPVRRGGTMRVAMLGGGESETLDPQKSVNEIDEAVSRQIHATLTVFGPGLTAQPYLAESLEPNADSTVWQVKLRPDVTFHSGKPLTADDVLYTWRRILDPETASAGAGNLADLDLERTRKVSPRELRVVMKRPRSDFPTLLFLREQSIIREGYGDADFRGTPDGLGPFQVESWTPGAQGEFSRFEGFFMPDEPYLDGLVFQSVEDNAARLNALLGGQVDAMSSLDFAQAKAQEGNEQIEVLRSQASAHTYPFYMRTDQAPFDDERVRQALRLAIDRQKIVETAYLGYGSVGNDMFGKGTQLYDDELPQRTYDPEQARSLLQQAGHSDLRVKLDVPVPYPGSPQSALAFAQAAKAAGITIDVEQAPPDRYWSNVYGASPFAMTDWSLTWNLIAPQTALPTSPYQETRYAPEAYVDVYERALAASDEAESQRLFNESQRVQHESGGYIVYAFADNLDATSRRVQGLDTRLPLRLGGYQFRKAWMTTA